MTRIRPAAWLIAAAALFLLAVAGYGLLVHASPQYYWTQIDAAVYRDSGIAVRNQPAMLYALNFGPAKLPFRYTPFAAILLAAGSGMSFATWQVGLAVLTIGLLPVVAYLSLGLAGRPPGPARAAAALTIAAVGLWLEPVAMTLSFGQINLVLLALVVGDFALPDRVKGKGIGIGLAAGIKLTPLIFVPYLLFTRRVKAAVVGALTFAVTVGLGFALLPHASAVYWGGGIARLGTRHFHLDNQSLNGVILRLTHAGPHAQPYWLVAAAVVGIAGLATSILASRRGHELLGLVACAATGLLVSPIAWSHHYVYVIPALVLAAYGPQRLGYRILGAALVVGLFGWWPLPIGNQGGYDPRAPFLPHGLLLLAPNRGNNPTTVEFTWRGLDLIVGNYYVLTLLVFIAATACALVLTRRPGPERAQSAPEPDAVWAARPPGVAPFAGRSARSAVPLVAVGCGLVLALGGCGGTSARAAAGRPSPGSAYTLMQMNLCLSGFGGCYKRVKYPAVVREAITRIRDARPDAVTFNEACSGDVALIARRTGYHLRFSIVIYNGKPLPCIRPGGRGLYGDAVLSKASILSAASQPFEAQAGPERREWLCVSTRVGIDVCTAHLAAHEPVEVAANKPQCAELRAVLARRAAARAVIFGGDVNRRPSCAPPGFWTRTDGSAHQDPGIQQVYGTGAFRSPSARVVPAVHTDHDVLLVSAYLSARR